MNELTKDEHDVYMVLVQEFLDSEDTEMALEYRPLTAYSKLLAELGFNTVREGSINLMHDGNNWDTNGWQVDFWWTFKREEKKFMIAGSLFYGKFVLSKE